MHIYFVRHGQTEFNKAGIIQGGTVDAPLTELGIVGARKLGEYLEEIKFDKVYVSPQQRAKDTASYILNENKQRVSDDDIIVDERLKEMMFGSYDGVTMEEFTVAGYYEVFRNRPDLYDLNPAGETYGEVTERAKKVLADILRRHKDEENILVVAHCITLTTLIKFLNGVAIKDYRKDGVLDNTSVTEIEFNNYYPKMLQYNYVPK